MRRATNSPMSASSANADTGDRIRSTEQMQRHASTQTWESGGLLRRYRGRGLRAPEAELFERHADVLGGRVLELGVGGGRLTGHLIELGGSVHGIDIAARMVAHCRRSYPAASFSEGDLHDASSWGSGSWDAIVAGWALIDVLADDERAAFFDVAHRLLNPGGLLIFSSHNLACATLLKSPFRSISVDTPLSFASQVLRLPRSYLNHRRLTRWERIEPDYAILNGAAHDFSLLHYYISRDGQERQLERHRFALLECIDAHGREVAAGDNALGSHELHYAALRQDIAPQSG
jgi:SAM-dependent methyltransferase